jgi:hypothetical protein
LHLRSHLEKVLGIVDPEMTRRRARMAGTPPTLSKFQMEEFEERVTRFVATSCLSLGVVESEDLHNLLAYFHPDIPVLWIPDPAKPTFFWPSSSVIPY